ncbi:hypothetical protein [Crateriforma spongiae]|uniref:hypothetical protein n=1 Tax=Crateriforma spongiae TaxID=2724528 RepID=UPI0014486858|nr:hypothetical protein [Crateriforma spongiae]
MRSFTGPLTLSAFGLLTVLASSPVLADDAATKTTEKINVLNEAQLTVPAAFKKSPPKSRIVEAEFVATDGKGDDEVTARVYGMASGGGLEPNIARWKGQFSESPEGAFKREAMKLGDWQVVIVDHAGSFSERMGGGPFAGGRMVKREDYAMTGAILQSPKGRLYFVKMIGPAKVVQANRDDFVKMIKSLDAS